MKQRKPLPRPTKPIARSTKRIERKAITRRPTKRKKAIGIAMTEAKDYYFGKAWYKSHNGYVPCQKCGIPIERHGCAAHHKIKRSLWATSSKREREACGSVHDKRNQVIICHHCHAWAHDESKPENLKSIRESPANAENGQRI